MLNRAVLLGIVSVLCFMPGPVDAREPLMVFSAASLTEALKELAVDFKKEYKVDVVFNFGGSSALKMQIEKGSPCDVFLAADKMSLTQLVQKKLIDEKEMVNLLINRLVVVANVRYPKSFSSLYDFQLKDGDYLAIADPATSSAGVYALQSLKRADVYAQVKPFIVPTMDVRAALALVGSGNVKYAMVYATDVQARPLVHQVYLIPGKLHDPIVYSAAVINRKVNLVPARNFLSFLQSEHSKIVFKKYGFQSF